MIYFIITTSIFNDCNIRKTQYTNGINQLKKIIKDLNIECKIIIVENNGKTDTFLNMFGCEVYYTANNFLKITNNRGNKELQDTY